MPTTKAELTVAQSWIGNVETKAEFNERFDRHLAGSVANGDREVAINLAIEESLRERLAVMALDQPASVSVAGISVGYGENIRALRESLEKFQATFGVGGTSKSPLRLVRDEVR